MEPIFNSAIPIIPAADCAASLQWWTTLCGFEEVFRDATSPNYAGIKRGEAHLHISAMTDKALARQVGDQTMIRFSVTNIEAFYAEYQQRGGQVHPNGKLQSKPWAPPNSPPSIPTASASPSSSLADTLLTLE